MGTESDTQLGEQLVRMGVIDATELRAMLSVQSELRAAHGRAVLDPLSRRFRLGRLLVESGIIDEATLAKALADSRRSGRRLGEQLVQEGAISGEVLQRSLEKQRRLMAIALSSAALSVPTHTKAADTTRLQVVATVVARATIESQRLPSEVVVSAEDVARGYVDMPVEIGVRANHGVMLGFSPNSRDVADIDVSGSTHVAPAGRGMRSQLLSFLLRLRLAPGTQPGRIAYPVRVSLRS